jgi:hypothetical protein
VENAAHYAVEIGPDGILQRLEHHLGFLLLVGPSSQVQPLAAHALHAAPHALSVHQPPADPLEHAENGVICADAHQHFQQLVVLQEVEALELDPLLLKEVRQCLGESVELLDVRFEHGLGGLIEVFCGPDEPLHVLHGFLDDGRELLGLRGQLLLCVLAGEDGEQRDELFLVDDGQLKQPCQFVDAPEVAVAVPARKAAVLVVDDVQQHSAVLLDFPPQLIVVAEYDDQGEFLEVLPFQLYALEPGLVLPQHPLDFLLLVRLEVYLQQLVPQQEQPVLVDGGEGEFPR